MVTFVECKTGNKRYHDNVFSCTCEMSAFFLLAQKFQFRIEYANLSHSSMVGFLYSWLICVSYFNIFSFKLNYNTK